MMIVEVVWEDQFGTKITLHFSCISIFPINTNFKVSVVGTLLEFCLAFGTSIFFCWHSVEDDWKVEGEVILQWIKYDSIHLIVCTVYSGSK